MAFVIDDNYLAITAIVTICYQFAFFIVAATCKFDKVTDFAGGTNFVILALLTFVLHQTWHFRQIVLTALVVVWGFRLAIFLLLRILAWGEDKRFDDKRGNLLKFAAFWLTQAIWVWTVSLPVTVVNGSDRNPNITAADIVGWILWLIGLSIETVADQQKLNLKKNPASKGRWCDVGVWGWSRHPNYFGEILLWWGIFISSTPVLRNGQWAVIAGPIFITLLLLFLSGMPLLEESADKKHGNNPQYRTYKNRTSPLIPLPPALYRALPSWFKLVFLLELERRLLIDMDIIRHDFRTSFSSCRSLHSLPCHAFSFPRDRLHASPHPLAIPIFALSRARSGSLRIASFGSWRAM